MNNFLISCKNAGKFFFLWLLFLVVGSLITTFLFNTLLFLFHYPNSIDKTFNNPLLILIPSVFLCFSIPSLITLSIHKKFSYKKRFAMLLESHGFFFFVQLLFWCFFAYYGIEITKTILEFASSTSKTTQSMAEIFLPIITLNLLPFLSMFFIWVSIKISFIILIDEEKNLPQEFIFSNEQEIYFTSPKIITAFSLLEICNILTLLLVLLLFLPTNAFYNIVEYLPTITSNPNFFLFCFIQYFLVNIDKKEKRIQFIYTGIIISTLFYIFVLILESFLWQLLFTGFYATQLFAYYQLIRYGKNYFNQ